MDSLSKKLELVANIAIIAVAVLLCAVLVKSYLLPASVGGTAARPTGTWKGLKRGDSVAVSGIDWQKNGKTLLLALSTTCHFCTQSAPFYQHLVKEHGGARLIALVPQEAYEGRAYLKKLGVGIDDVRKAAMGELGLSGTPTLILVDNLGRIVDIWVGALPPDRQEEVISRLWAESNAQ